MIIIWLIAKLAVFFEISVDVLLAYEWKKHNMGQAVECIKKLNMDKKFDEASDYSRSSIRFYHEKEQTFFDGSEETAAETTEGMLASTRKYVKSLQCIGSNLLGEMRN